jgi:hypothetical protein
VQDRSAGCNAWDTSALELTADSSRTSREVRDSWEFRTAADEATVAKPGYPEGVAMIVQIGDHLGKQYDVKG